MLEVAPNLGIAVGTDGVGSKLIVAEQTGRYDTVGIDCIAMNVNDVICVGAEPIAVLDYLAVERADEAVMRAIGVGPEGGRRGRRASRSPAARSPCCPELIRGHPSPHGFDLTAACFGTVALDAMVTGARCAPGDALIGLPVSRPALQRLLARPRACCDGARARRDARPRSAAPPSPTRCSSRP